MAIYSAVRGSGDEVDHITPQATDPRRERSFSALVQSPDGILLVAKDLVDCHVAKTETIVFVEEGWRRRQNRRLQGIKALVILRTRAAAEYTSRVYIKSRDQDS